MKKFLLASCATMMVGVGSAFAADVSAPAMHDWTGLYAGVFGGYAFSGDDAVGVTGFGPNLNDLSLNGIYGGVDLGYNHQIDNIVLGIEGDIAFADISDSDSGNGFSSKDDLNYVGTLRGRAGFAIDNALIYATGGVAFTSSDYRVTDGALVDIKDSFSRAGYVLGGGVEYAFDDQWSMKAEYLYMNFGHKWLSDGVAETKATPDFHSVRLGLNYSF